MSRVKCSKLSNISANIAVAIFRVNLFLMVEHFWQPYIGQAVGGELDLMVLIGGVEERAAIQLEMSPWLKEWVGLRATLDKMMKRKMHIEPSHPAQSHFTAEPSQLIQMKYSIKNHNYCVKTVK
jgi:hypothetical protein